MVIQLIHTRNWTGVAVCCSVLQCVAVRAMWYSCRNVYINLRYMLHGHATHAHTNESCHTDPFSANRIRSEIWTSHVTHINKSCYARHTQNWVTSHKVAFHKNESCHMHEMSMPHICTGHATQTDQSYHTYQCVLSHTLTVDKKDSRRTYTWVKPHILRLNHLIHMNKSSHAHSLRVRRIYVARMHESCHMCEWIIAYTWISPLAHTHFRKGKFILYVCTSQLWIFLRKILWGIRQETSMRKLCIRVAYPGGEASLRGPEEGIWPDNFGKKNFPGGPY